MRFAFAVTVVCFVAACSTAPIDPNANVINVEKVDDRFSGTVGSAWTDARLESEVLSTICAPGQSIDGLRIKRDGVGGATFFGQCV